jgi:uncharacterized membrane protein YfcA
MQPRWLVGVIHNNQINQVLTFTTFAAHITVWYVFLKHPLSPPAYQQLCRFASEKLAKKRVVLALLRVGEGFFGVGDGFFGAGGGGCPRSTC